MPRDENEKGSPKRAARGEYDASKATGSVDDNRYDELALDHEVVGSIYQGTDLILKHYKLGKKLGAGAFAVVRAAVSRQNKKTFAAKFISKLSPSFRVESMQREICILKKMDHPNIMRLYAVYDEPKRTTLLLELVLGSNLMDRILKTNQLFSEKKAERLATDIMGALRYMHSMNIAHRDLKPENLMYGSDDPGSHQFDRIKVCDLGLARQYENGELLQSPCGTPGYMAPELLAKRPYGSKVDIWAIGVTLYQMLCGFLPYPHVEDEEDRTLQNMTHHKVQFPDEFWADFTADCKDIIAKMIDPDESTRLTASECLEHPWIKYQGETSAAGVHGNHKAFLMLRRLPLFACVDPSCLGEITNRLKRKVFEPGDTIVKEGEVGESMFFVESGHVRIVIDGREVDQLRGGTFFGEVALIVKKIRRTATAMVPERKGLPFPASLFELQRSHFLEVAEKYPILKQQLINYAAMRLNRYLRHGPLRDVAESNVAKQAVVEVLKKIGSEVSDQSMLTQSRLLKRNGQPEDWRGVWRSVIHTVIAVNRILRIAKRQRQRSEKAEAEKELSPPSMDEVKQTEQALAADGYVRGADGIWRSPGDAASAGVDVSDPAELFSHKAWPYAASPLSPPSRHPLHQELWRDGDEIHSAMLGGIAENGNNEFDPDPVLWGRSNSGGTAGSSSPGRPRLSHRMLNSTPRLHSDMGSGKSLGAGADSLASRGKYSSPRAKGQRRSFNSSSSLSLRSTESDEDDFEFEEFCEEMRRQVGDRRQSDRRTSTLPYLEPVHIGDGSPHTSLRPPLAGAEELEKAEGNGVRPSKRGLLAAGSRTGLVPLEKEKEDCAEAIVEVDAPPKPSWSACSGVCAVQ